ncbi:hypothetical protein FOXYSP1_07977 [Fusarium oxysporum f. sp. phaseoli]
MLKTPTVTMPTSEHGMMSTDATADGTFISVFGLPSSQSLSILWSLQTATFPDHWLGGVPT